MALAMVAFGGLAAFAMAGDQRVATGGDPYRVTASKLRDELVARGVEARFVPAPGGVETLAGVAKMPGAEPAGFEFRLYPSSDQATVRGLGRMRSTDFGWPREQLHFVFESRIRGVLGNVAFAEYEWFDLNTHRSRVAAIESQLAEQRLLRAIDDALFASYPASDPYVHALSSSPG